MKWFDLRSALGVLGGWALALVAILAIAATGAVADDAGAEPLTPHTLTSFDIDHHLRLDPDGTVGMDVVETIDAEFTDTDPRRGITRVLPLEKSGIDTEITVHAVRDGAGQPLDWTETASDGQLRVDVGDQQPTSATRRTYVIEYSLASVVRDSSGDEMAFQRDVLGAEWPHRSERTAVTIRMADSVADHLHDSEPFCAEGTTDAMDFCEFTRSEVSGETVLTATAPTAVGPAETFLIGLHFKPGSFTDPSLSGITITNRVVPAALLLGLLGASLTLVVLGATRRRRWLRGRPVVATFQPRSDLPPVVASIYYGRPDRGISAELLAAAQRGDVVLRDTPAGLEAERVRTEDPNRSLSAAAVGLFFTREQGSRRLLGEKPAKGPANLLADKFRTWLRGRRTPFTFAPDILRGPPVPQLAVVIVPLVVILTLQRGALEEWALVGGVLAIGCLAVLAGCLGGYVGLKDEHRDEFAHLEGLRWFIALSEAERMAVVQGAETAQRFGPEDQVRIHDRLLPYAVAFGLETTWQATTADKIATVGGLRPGEVPTALSHTRRAARRNRAVRAAATGHRRRRWFGGIGRSD